MGTLFAITVYAANEQSAHGAARAAFKRVAELDRILSDYNPESELTRLRRQPPGEPVVVSGELFDVLRRSQRISARTSGAFDITIGPLVQLWRTARKSGVLPTDGEIAEAQSATGHQKLKLNPQARTVTLLAPRMRLDPGGIGKGYAADQALATLRRHGIRRAMVAASGDIAVGDPPPGKRGWTVGITLFDRPAGETVRTVVVDNCGVSTSGDIEQFVEIGGMRYSHIVDPATGVGLTERIQVTVIAPDATSSDSLATAVSVLGAKRGQALVESMPDTAAMIAMSVNGKIRVVESQRFKRHGGVLLQGVEPTVYRDNSPSR